jgi:hypothetical protein
VGHRGQGRPAWCCAGWHILVSKMFHRNCVEDPHVCHLPASFHIRTSRVSFQWLHSKLEEARGPERADPRRASWLWVHLLAGWTGKTGGVGENPFLGTWYIGICRIVPWVITPFQRVIPVKRLLLHHNSNTIVSLT